LNVSVKEDWLTGVYFIGDILRTAIVAIHQLPRVPETLWLRLLGRGTVQQQAIEEINLLSSNHPFQKATLELIYNLRENLKINQNLEEDDRELIMRLEPLYQQDREQAKQEGRQEGERLVVENLLKVRFGSLDEELQTIIEPILALTPAEFTPLLIQLSREELIQRFTDIV
jgi:flagellar biosynthesis/type III secretory pathway protein FliH